MDEIKALAYLTLVSKKSEHGIILELLNELVNSINYSELTFEFDFFRVSIMNRTTYNKRVF